MSQNPTAGLSFSPGVRVMIPLLYAAWSDRVLTPSEVTALQNRASNLAILNDEDKAQLLAWSQPANPPSRDLFKFWEITCLAAAEGLPPNQPASLIELGLLIAKQDAPEVIAEWSEGPTRNRLNELEQALGNVNQATYRSLFPAEAQQPLAPELGETSFDSAELQRLLDGPYQDTLNRTKTILQDPAFAAEPLALKEAYREQVLQWTKLLAEQGLGSLSYPNAYGGKGDMGLYAAVFETLAYYDLSLTIKFGVQFGLWGGSVQWLGTKKHHDAYLRDIGTLALPGCFAMTETGHGSNVRGLETTATYDPTTENFIIHTPREEAGKEYIGNAAAHGRMASVFAQLIVGGVNHGVHALVVPLRDAEGRLMPGVRIEDNGRKLGLNGVDNGKIWFDQVQVPRENLLDRFGQVSAEGEYSSPIENPSRRFFTMLGTLVGGRVCVPRAGLNATKKALTIAIRYADRRRQFAPNATAPETPILDYPSHQRRLMPLLAKTYALQFGLDHLLHRFIERDEEDIREIETLAAGMKSYATWFTTAAIQECREACGGKGYLFENQFADLKADSDIFTTFEGDNTVLMQLVAKGVLSDFRQSFHEDGNMATLRYLGRRINTAITQQNPIAIRNTDKGHLRSGSFQLDAFRFREERLLMSLAQRLRGHIKQGKSAYEAAMTCQTHMLALAEAYVERQVLEAYMAKIKSLDKGPVKRVLKDLSRLYALHTIERHKGWYLEQDYLAGSKSKAIRRQVDQLCSSLRQDALALVEAFGIPEKLLNAPIAR